MCSVRGVVEWGEGLWRRRWTTAAVLLPVVLVAGLSARSSPGTPRRSEAAAPDRPPSVAAYRGLGSWVDIYDRDALRDPGAAVAAMAANGVRTLYLQTGNYRHPYAIVHPAKDADFLRASHALGLRVVAWYLPLFRDVDTDFRRSMRSIRFETSDGQRFDGFALDIEAPQVPPEERIANMRALSAQLREAVGPSYALGAIIPSPRGLIRAPTYWPGFPYAELPKYYDVIMPMSYWTFRYDGAEAAHWYISGNVRIVRNRIGIHTIPIHVIGGVTADTSPAEARAFVRAVRKERIIGASLYEYAGMTSDLWRAMSRIGGGPVEPA
jgi:hypothetical protein